MRRRAEARLTRSTRSGFVLGFAHFMFTSTLPCSCAIDHLPTNVGIMLSFINHVGGARQLKILVTGANGFIGRGVCSVLAQRGHTLVRAVRGPARPDELGELAIGEVNGDTAWEAALRQMPEAVVHLAARAHVTRAAAGDAEACWRTNVDGAVRLAECSAAAGVRRFVFMSSVKVMGEGDEHPYRESDEPAPVGVYAHAKWEAEQRLREIAEGSGMELVVLRPPLVYGCGVKANFFSLMRAVDKGIPLPLGAVANRRSLIYLDNLADAVALSLTHPGAAGKTYLVSDGEDVSSAELVRRIAEALGRAPRLVSVAPRWLRLAARLVGKAEAADRLLGSLTVDSRAVRSDLGWSPPHTMHQGLAATAAWYRMAASGAPSA